MQTSSIDTQNIETHSTHSSVTCDEISLNLHITDSEMINELVAFPEGRNRNEFAISAMRIGILSIKQSEGQIDTSAIRNEGERLVAEISKQLGEHQTGLMSQMTNSIKEYFDPKDGRFNERLERLLSEDGELEQVLRKQLGSEESELTKTLSLMIGESSPLMKALDPESTNGILNKIHETVSFNLKTGSENILSEFSLDNESSALSRLVSEVTKKHGKLTEDLQGSIKDVVNEFSLDDENSALSRLVKRVEDTQGKISSEFSLDTETSALARMKREMLEVLATHKQDSSKFQQEVREALADMKVRKEESKRSTIHGDEFEKEMFSVVSTMHKNSGDIVTSTGNSTGSIKNCKKGDIVIELGPEHLATGSKIVIEAKESASYDTSKALSEINEARKNRNAEIGIFVFSSESVDESYEPFTRYGSDLVVVWDAHEAQSDIYLQAAISVAKALCSRKSKHHTDTTVDFNSIDNAISQIGKQLEGLDAIHKMASTIENNGEKIIRKTGSMKKAISKELEVLEERTREASSVIEELNK